MSDALYAVYGASGCGRGIMPLARTQLRRDGIPSKCLVFVDDSPAAKTVNGHRVLTYTEFKESMALEKHVALAIADSRVRERLALRVAADGMIPWSVRAEGVVMMDAVAIGEGALLSPFVTLTSNIQVGRYFHANVYSYVEHDCMLGNFVTFAPGVKCNGNVHVEDHVYIGTGAIIRQGKPGKPLVIGKGATVGMGAVVTKSVPPGVTVIGNPARPMAI